MLLICGSLQVASSNRSALQVMSGSIAGRRGVDLVESVDIATIGAFNAELVGPIDAVDRLRAQLAACDVVVIATPEYAGSLPGALKNALDWIVGSGELYAKPVVVVSAGTSGGVHARHHLIQTLTWQGAHVVASLGIAAPRTKSDASGAFTDPATIGALADLADLAVAAPRMTPDKRREHVLAVLRPLGIDEAHVAPMPE